MFFIIFGFKLVKNEIENYIDFKLKITPHLFLLRCGVLNYINYFLLFRLMD